MSLKEIIEALESIQGNPWILTFAALFLIGYMLKEHTTLNNKLIPWILFIVGGVLGLIIIEMSVAGVIIGCIMSYIVMAAYEHIRTTIALVLNKK